VIHMMFRGFFNSEGCVNFLFVPLYLRRTHHGLGIYQYHMGSLCSHIRAFASSDLSESAESVGSNVVAKYRLLKHEYIHGRRTRTR